MSVYLILSYFIFFYIFFLLFLLFYLFIYFFNYYRAAEIELAKIEKEMIEERKESEVILFFFSPSVFFPFLSITFNSFPFFFSSLDSFFLSFYIFAFSFLSYPSLDYYFGPFSFPYSIFFLSHTFSLSLFFFPPLISASCIY